MRAPFVSKERETMKIILFAVLGRQIALRSICACYGHAFLSDAHCDPHRNVTPARRASIVFSRIHTPVRSNAVTMSFIMFRHTSLSKLASRLFVALVCCCLLLQPVRCLPARLDVSHLERRAIVLVSNVDEKRARRLAAHGRNL